MFRQRGTAALNSQYCAGAALAEVVEGADADQRFHLLIERLDAQEEIGQRSESPAGAFAQDGFLGATGEALDLQERHADGLLAGRAVPSAPQAPARWGQCALPL